MNYIKIHDSIIDRAKSRSLCESTHYENHHILPKCEGGAPNGATVSLTQKEHKIIHLLRWKMTGVIQNYYAYCLLSSDKRKVLSQIAAKMSHLKFKERDPIAYEDRQRKAGIIGGQSAKNSSKGIFALSEKDKKLARDKGRETLVKNKVGMFSDEYRKIHAKSLMKKVLTPDGIFDSMLETAKHYQICPGSVTYRCGSTSEKFHEWKIIEAEGQTNVTNG